MTTNLVAYICRLVLNVSTSNLYQVTINSVKIATFRKPITGRLFRVCAISAVFFEGLSSQVVCGGWRVNKFCFLLFCCTYSELTTPLFSSFIIPRLAKFAFLVVSVAAVFVGWVLEVEVRFLGWVARMAGRPVGESRLWKILRWRSPALVWECRNSGKTRMRKKLIIF